MLYLSLMFDIRKKQIHNLAMAVRKNRTYKAHGINTIYLQNPIGFDFRTLQHVYKRHHLNSQLAPIKSFNSITSFFIERLLSVQYTDQEDGTKVSLQDYKDGTRIGHTRDRVWNLTPRQGELSGTSVLTGYSHLQHQNVPNPGTDYNDIKTMA